MANKLGPYELNTIVTGDARELAKAIPDESVDLIFTDPPYPRKYHFLYEFLSQMASRVLKLDGWLIVYSSNALFRMELESLETNLQLFTILCIWEPGMNYRMFDKHIIGGWRPLFLMKRKDSDFLPPWIPNAMSSTFRDKKYHNWGQNIIPAKTWIKYLCPANGITIDPFIGGGTTAAACHQVRRNYLAFEIDPETAELARQRVANTQPPLPIVYPEQMELLPD